MERKRGDRRTRYTKRVIKETLFDLLQHKNLEDISVTELCNLADINRGTFYKYYADVPDLFHKLENELYEQITGVLDNCHFQSSHSMYRQLLDILLDNREMVTIVLPRETGHSRLIPKIINYSKRQLLEEPENNVSSVAPELSEYIFSYRSAGTEAIFIHWIATGMKTPAEDICNLILQLNKYISPCSI